MNEKIELRELYSRHQGKISDKWESYINFFEVELSAYRFDKINILEIGIQNGGSLEIWAKYFPKAEGIVGCDIAEAASNLKFSDPRINVVVGDANAPETFSQISETCNEFDIIIDDGSHKSDDIIRSFAHYFPLLRDGGIYIVEDLHCSYWGGFQGGLEAPFSSMNFLKRLSDLVNREHWGGEISSEVALDFYAQKFGIAFDSIALNQVVEVRFRNSICMIKKGPTGSNSIGRRVVAGMEGIVEPRISIALNGADIGSPDESGNMFGPNAERLESSAAAAPDFAKQLEQALAQCKTLSRQNGSLQAALRLSRRHPLVELRNKIAFKVLHILGKASPPLPRRMAWRFARSADRRNPDREL